MATLSYFEPQLVGNAGPLQFTQVAYAPKDQAAFRRGDLLINSITGAIVAPPGPTGGSGALAGIAGPAASAVTLAQVATAGAPAKTYFVKVTYAATSAESGVSQELVINCPAGNTFSVNVAAAGAPTGATSYNAYVSTLPGYEAKQNAAIVALGTATTMTSPLTNYQGVVRAATGVSSGIVGLSVQDSNAVYFNGIGGSFLVGNQSLFGATNSVPPLTPAESFLIYAAKLQLPQVLEMSLINTTAWSPALIGTQAGLTLDATTGIFVVDPAQTAAVLIIGSSDGANSVVGTVGDGGKRIQVTFLAGAVA